MEADGPVRYELHAESVALLTLSRPDSRNAQDLGLLYALNDAFDRAAADDAVNCIVLAGDGPHFSSGHDLRDRSDIEDFDTVGNWCGFSLPGAEGFMAREEEIYMGFCRRWRDLPKPTIAAVHGKVIAGGLMLAWVCDLIIASDDANFCDPVVGMGVNGVEWFAHPWELGPRKAKELLWTSDWWSAAEAHRLGMVNHVVPRSELLDFALTLAGRIASRPSFALKLVKESVNQSVDAQGQRAALLASFSLHQLAHSHNQQRFGAPIDPSGVPAKLRVPPDSTVQPGSAS
ncbi:MAG: enoyl-CoA hydratase [Acidimicrobiales bacterium]